MTLPVSDASQKPFHLGSKGPEAASLGALPFDLPRPHWTDDDIHRVGVWLTLGVSAVIWGGVGAFLILLL